MPKIIKNIEKNILNAAFELFGEYGYKEVDMKKIAKKAGIAVGTLYNYYSNKKELFIRVFEMSWENTFSRLDDMLQRGLSAKEKMRNFIEILYDEIISRKGLGGELFKENVLTEKNSKELIFMKEELSQRTQRLLKELRSSTDIKLSEAMDDRIALTVFMLIIEMLRQFPSEKERNLEFINQLLESIYKE